MSLIKKILVPVDGSEHSKKALTYAKEIAEKFHSEVTILHVYEVPLPPTGYEYSSDIFDDIKKSLNDSGLKILDNSADIFDRTGLKVNKILLTGNQGYHITEEAEKNNFDLIVMGSRDLGSIRSVLLGSTSNYVVHHTEVPVMLIH